MKKKFIKKNIAIIGLTSLVADLVYANCEPKQNNSVYICSETENRNNIITHSEGHIISVILNDGYQNKINNGLPIFDITSNAGVSFEQKVGSKIINTLGNGLNINASETGDVNINISGNITVSEYAVNSFNHVTSGDATTNIDISGVIESSSTATDIVSVTNVADDGKAIITANITGNIESSGEEISAELAALNLNNRSEANSAIVNVNLSGKILSNDHGIRISNHFEAFDDASFDDVITKTHVQLQENSEIIAYTDGLRVDNIGASTSNVLLDIAGKITSKNDAINVINSASGLDFENPTDANIMLNLTETSELNSANGLVLNNHAQGNGTIQMDIAGKINASDNIVNIINIASEGNATTSINIHETAELKFSDEEFGGVGINIMSDSFAEQAAVLIDVAGTIHSSYDSINIKNHGFNEETVTNVKIDLAETGQIISNKRNGIQVDNSSYYNDTNVVLDLAGEIYGDHAAVFIGNQSRGETGNATLLANIAQSANIQSQYSDAMALYNSATEQANMIVNIEGEVKAEESTSLILFNDSRRKGGKAQIDVTLTESANIISNNGQGMVISNEGGESSIVNMSVSGNIASSKRAIELDNRTNSEYKLSSTNLYIAESGKIVSEQGEAIHILGEDVNIAVNGTVSGTTGIVVNGSSHMKDTNVSLYVAGKIEGTNGSAIELSGNTTNLSLGAGWDINGQTHAYGIDESFLTLTGNRNSFLDLSRINDWDNENGLLGFNHFVKEGSSSWYLSNSLDQESGFDSAIINSGSIVLDNATFAMTDLADNAFTIASTAATLYNYGDSSIIGDVDNAGVISFSAPILNKNYSYGPTGTLTINGNYHGDNGYLVMNTELMDDSAQTDKLIIDGDTSGSTTVVVNNRGGIGGQTQNGIEIIEVNGNSDSDAFSLAGDYTLANGESAIVAGAYAYTLQQHDHASGSNGNWYLRSTQLGANTPMHEVYPRVLLALNGLPTLKQRTGGRYLQDTPVSHYASYLDAYNAEQTDTRDLWVRMDREYIKFNPEQSATESAYDIHTFNLLMGYDGFKRQTDKGTLIAGANVHIGRAQANTTSYFGDGRIHTNAYGFGFNGTWYSKDGYYVDGQSKFNWLRSDLTSKETHTTLEKNNNGFGYAFGVEGGKRIRLDDSWTMIPQAQLTWSSVNFNQFKDIYDANVSINKGDSLQARLGLSIENQTSWLDGNGELSHRNIYGIANFYTELMDETKITVDDVSLVNKSDRNWAELGLGLNYGWNNNRYNAFVELSSRSSLKDFADTYAVKGTMGVKISF